MPKGNVTPAELQARLIKFGVAVCRTVRDPCGLVGEHIAGQLVRSATSPAALYAEARGAESRRDFIHKMQLCLKELQETEVWLAFEHELSNGPGPDDTLCKECDELVSIFVAAVKTAKSRN
jgi:four helix bundle protein